MALTMSSFHVRGLLLAAAVVGLTAVGIGQERDRTKIADRYKWNLADIYPSDAAWRSAREALAARHSRQIAGATRARYSG